MHTFFTMLAVVLFVITSLRIFFTLVSAGENEELVRLAQAMGKNIVHDALKWPIIIWVVSACWLISLLF